MSLDKILFVLVIARFVNCIINLEFLNFKNSLVFLIFNLSSFVLEKLSEQSQWHQIDKSTPSDAWYRSLRFVDFFMEMKNHAIIR